MIFNFLKYIKPIWYFNLKPNQDFGYFPTISQLEKIKYPFEIDLNFKTKIAQERDVAFTAFQQGYISKEKENGLNVWTNETIAIDDEYVFLRKNFHKGWVYYVLIIRLLTLNNIFKEIIAFAKSRRVKRFDYTKKNYQYTDYLNFESKLLIEKPFVSVIIPTLNRYAYLKTVLQDLENQNYKNFEVIIVDQTDDYQAKFYQNWQLNLKYWYQPEKALWKARNEAIATSKGNLILLYDDDSLIENDWITQHIKTLDYFQAAISSGVSISKHGDTIPAHYGYFRWSDQIDTGNVMIRKHVFETVGMFDCQFEKQRMGDGEFGLRCYLAGFKNISNPNAQRIHLKVAQGGLRQMGSWDGWRPKKLLSPRPVPSVLYLSRKYFGTTWSKYYILHSILPSLIPYRFKGNKILKTISFIALPLVLPLIIYQVIASWQAASKKLREGRI